MSARKRVRRIKCPHPGCRRRFKINPSPENSNHYWDCPSCGGKVRVYFKKRKGWRIKKVTPQ